MSLPPEVIAYQEAHVDESRQGAVIAAISVTFTLAVISVVLRFVARYVARVPLKSDDWLILVALVIATGYTASDGLSVRFGLGRHVILLTDPVSFLANSLAAEILWAAALLVTKISIILLYLRLFPSKNFRIAAYCVLGLVVAYSTASILTFLFQCTPIEKSWEPEVPGTCIAINIAFPTTGAINILTDIIILSMPLPYVWRLKLDTTRKLQVAGMFLLGGLVCVISITRVVYVERVSTLDSTWTFTDAAIWTQSEVCTAIISACLPTYRPLLRGRKGATQDSSYATRASKGYGPASRRYSKMPDTLQAGSADDTIPLDGIKYTVNIDVESSTAQHSRAASDNKV